MSDRTNQTIVIRATYFEPEDPRVRGGVELSYGETVRLAYSERSSTEISGLLASLTNDGTPASFVSFGVQIVVPILIVWTFGVAALQQIELRR